MAFRPPTSQEKVPKCEECRGGNPNLLGSMATGHRWVCAACEYREAYPNGPIVPAHPLARAPIPLQRETLFDREASP